MVLSERVKKIRDHISEFFIEPRWIILSKTKADKHGIVSENKRMYENSAVVEDLSSMSYLQKPEETVLKKLKIELKNMRMLDIGIGGGRTTCHFASLTKEYVGIDYARNMIKACKRRFKFPKEISFLTCDVRFLPFKDGYFDFILFSFNGIDLMSYEDRLTALKEIKRVGKENGYFCFSAHNLFFLDDLFSFKLSKDPMKLSKNVRLFLLLRFMNDDYKELKKKPFVIINDPSHNCKELALYTRPQNQTKQLIDLGFKTVEVISLDGKQVADTIQLNYVRDPWLYYLCQI
jgi:ubiquinone/menaquinone biosynthesis C-methylase UbiE